MWTRERVLNTLGEYREAKARCKHIEAEISEYQAIIDGEMAHIEAIADIGAQQLTGMPRGNAVGNPTEKKALKLASGWVPEEVRTAKETIIAFNRELTAKRMIIAYVDAWLSGLNEQEAWVIERQMLNGEHWSDLQRLYRQHYSQDVKTDGLKRIKRAALAKIYQIAGVKDNDQNRKAYANQG